MSCRRIWRILELFDFQGLQGGVHGQSPTLRGEAVVPPCLARFDSGDIAFDVDSEIETAMQRDAAAGAPTGASPVFAAALLGAMARPATDNVRIVGGACPHDCPDTCALGISRRRRQAH